MNNAPKRPITGADYITLRENLGIQTLGVQWLLGLNSMNYTSAISEKPHTKGPHKGKSKKWVPVSNPTRAVMTRFLFNHPEFSPIRRAPRPLEVLELVRTARDYEATSKSEFGMMLGCEIGSGHRWAKGGGTSPAIDAVLIMLDMVLTNLPTASAKRDFLNDWNKAVREEANYRGIPKDVFESRGFIGPEALERVLNPNAKATAARKKAASSAESKPAAKPKAKAKSKR